jgi:hypothetical protein
MPNMMLPPEERNLTPEQVDVLDRRRRHGHFYLVMGTQFLLISIFVLLWSGQDATYSPGWAKPMVYWDATLFVLAMITLSRGVALRRGMNEFFSY